MHNSKPWKTQKGTKQELCKVVRGSLAGLGPRTEGQQSSRMSYISHLKKKATLTPSFLILVQDSQYKMGISVTSSGETSTTGKGAWLGAPLTISSWTSTLLLTCSSPLLPKDIRVSKWQWNDRDPSPPPYPCSKWPGRRNALFSWAWGFLPSLRSTMATGGFVLFIMYTACLGILTTQ